MPTWKASKAGYENLWRQMEVIRDDAVANQVSRIMLNKERYQLVENATGVPWPLVAAFHSRESNLAFSGILHSGERIIGTGRKSSKKEPKGRGPFDSWHDSAIDAMKFKALHKVSNWTAAKILYHAEEYNGWGYVRRKVNSPYIWAGTSLEQPGKFIEDHVFDPNAIDKQLGVAALIRGIADVDADVANLVDDTSITTPPDIVTPAGQTIPQMIAQLKQATGAKSVLLEW